MEHGRSQILRGVADSSLQGLYGRPYLILDDVLAEFGVTTTMLAPIHEEICLALAQLPTRYTGGAHRAMGIMPPSRVHEAIADYTEVLSAMTPSQWNTFVALADDPAAYAEVSAHDVGEERAAPLSARQMQWLKVRFGVYFPWKSYLELIPNERWEDKGDVDGKDFTRVAKTLLPSTIQFVRTLPFAGIGRCNIMGLEAHDHGTVHRDGDPHEQIDADEFITVYPVFGKKLSLWDEDRRRATVLPDAHFVWFNDHDYHAVESAPMFRYSLRVDGPFLPAFRQRLEEVFG